MARPQAAPLHARQATATPCTCRPQVAQSQLEASLGLQARAWCHSTGACACLQACRRACTAQHRAALPASELPALSCSHSAERYPLARWGDHGDLCCCHSPPPACCRYPYVAGNNPCSLQAQSFQRVNTGAVTINLADPAALYNELLKSSVAITVWADGLNEMLLYLGGGLLDRRCSSACVWLVLGGREAAGRGRWSGTVLRQDCTACGCCHHSAHYPRASRRGSGSSTAGPELRMHARGTAALLSPSC